jgi:hypothetical protein
MTYPVRKPFLPSDRTRSSQPIIRAATATLLVKHQRKPIAEVLKATWPTDKNVEFVTRAASSVGTTTAATWAAELVGRGVADIISVLGPASAGATAMLRGLNFTWEGGYGSIGIPAVTAVKTNAAFIQEAKPIPVFKTDTSKMLQLSARKLAALTVFTREIFEHSVPNIELLVRTALTESVGLALDALMFDATAGDAVRPAGLLAGINATAASGAATALEAMKSDIGALTTAVAPVAGSSPILLIASPAQAMALKLWKTGGESAFEVLPSGALAAGTIIAIASNCLASAADPTPRFDLTDQGLVQMDDATASLTDIVVAGGTVNAGTVKALWQTDSLGLKTVFNVSWGLRSATGLAWMQSVNW